MADRLRPLWDFDDLDTSEARFRAQLDRETTNAGRAEVLTQLARVEGLRGSFDECDAFLDQAEQLGGAEARVSAAGASARRAAPDSVSPGSNRRTSSHGPQATTCSRWTRRTCSR
jgi:hypothetical protein